MQRALLIPPPYGAGRAGVEPACLPGDVAAVAALQGRQAEPPPRLQALTTGPGEDVSYGMVWYNKVPGAGRPW